MSATSGILICRLISPSFSAASRTGTAQRTMSQPAASSAQISSSVACTSRVSVLVMDCTVIGAPPPTLIPPISICRVFRRAIIVPSYLKILNASLRTLPFGRDLDRPGQVRQGKLERDELPEPLGREESHVPRLHDSVTGGHHRVVRLVADHLGDDAHTDAADLEVLAGGALLLHGG